MVGGDLRVSIESGLQDGNELENVGYFPLDPHFPHREGGRHEKSPVPELVRRVAAHLDADRCRRRRFIAESDALRRDVDDCVWVRVDEPNAQVAVPQSRCEGFVFRKDLEQLSEHGVGGFGIGVNRHGCPPGKVSGGYCAREVEMIERRSLAASTGWSRDSLTR